MVENKDRKKKIPPGILLLALSAYQLAAHYTKTKQKKKHECVKRKPFWMHRTPPNETFKRIFKGKRARQAEREKIIHGEKKSAINFNSHKTGGAWATPTCIIETNLVSRTPEESRAQRICRSKIIRNSFGILNQCLINTHTQRQKEQTQWYANNQLSHSTVR